MEIRSTWGSRLSYLARQSNRIAGEIGETSEKVTTGLEVRRPSDAPELTTRIHTIEQELADQARYADDAGMAEGILSVADAALNELAVVVSQARELALQMGSETYQGAQRVASAEMASQLLEQARGLMNTELGGRHVFGGQAYEAEPYAADRSYQGSTSPSEIDVSDTLSVTVGFDGEALGMGSVLEAMETLRQALMADDADAVLASLGGLIGASDTVSAAQTVVGVEQATAIDFAAFAKSMGVELEVQRSALIDADAVQAIVRLGELQAQYEATLAVTSRLQTDNLFSRI